MRKTKEQLAVFSIGAIAYPLLELLWRQYTHWSMSLAGGVCFSALYNIYNTFKRLTAFQRGVIGSAVITSVEFTVGVIVNIWKKWNVWDYSALKFNLLGQVCLLYSALWFVFSIPINIISKRLKAYFNNTPSIADSRVKEINFKITD